MLRSIPRFGAGCAPGTGVAAMGYAGQSGVRMPMHGRFVTFTAWCELADQREWDAFTAREVAYGHISSLMGRLGAGVHRVYVAHDGLVQAFDCTITLRPEISGVREVG